MEKETNKTPKVEEKIKILIKRPGQKPVLEEVKNTLNPLQKHVDGYIEFVKAPFDTDVNIMVNEMGKLENLDKNFIVPEYKDIIVGTAVFLNYDESISDFIDLTEEQIENIETYLIKNRLEPQPYLAKLEVV